MHNCNQSTSFEDNFEKGLIVCLSCLWIYDPDICFSSDIGFVSLGWCVIEPHNDIMWILMKESGDKNVAILSLFQVL